MQVASEKNYDLNHLIKKCTFVVESIKIMADKKQMDTSCAACSNFKNSIWSSLSSSDLQKIDQQKTCQHLKKGSIFLQEGAYPLGVYCIKHGKVKVYRHGDGRDQIIKVVGPGELLGYKSLLAEESYPVSAETLEDVHLCFIPKSTFLETLFISASFSHKILKMACKELEVMTGNITNMAQKTVRERTASTLLLLNQTYGSDSLEDGSAPINLRREDIASIVGTATETLIRLLADFKQENLIQIDGRKVIVTNIQGLRKVAGL